MSKKKAQASTPDVLEESSKKVADVFNNAEFYFEEYKNIILGVVIVAIVAIGGWWGYNSLIKGPKETKGRDAIYYAQKYFDIDSFSIALKGDGLHPGFESIAKQYSGTSASNRANFCAGICNLKLGKYAEAVKYLENTNSPDPIISARIFGGLGDAYAEQNKMDKALDYYKKAIDATDNEKITPSYLFRAALVYEQKGSKKDALDLYKKLNTNYPETPEGVAAEKYIGKLEALTF